MAKVTIADTHFDVIKAHRTPFNLGRVSKNYAPKKISHSEMTPANKRAHDRLKAHRAIWANTPSRDRMTRQRTRRAEMGRI